MKIFFDTEFTGLVPKTTLISIGMVAETGEKWINAIVEKPTVLKTVVVMPKDGCIKAFADEFGLERRKSNGRT